MPRFLWVCEGEFQPRLEKRALSGVPFQEPPRMRRDAPKLAVFASFGCDMERLLQVEVVRAGVPGLVAEKGIPGLNQAKLRVPAETAGVLGSAPTGGPALPECGVRP
jgi:hypothetical protein